MNHSETNQQFHYHALDISEALSGGLPILVYDKREEEKGPKEVIALVRHDNGYQDYFINFRHMYEKLHFATAYYIPQPNYISNYAESIAKDRQNDHEYLVIDINQKYAPNRILRHEGLSLKKIERRLPKRGHELFETFWADPLFRFFNRIPNPN